jgi:hypothetical protein
VFGVKDIDEYLSADKKFPAAVHGCSGPELEELRRKATLEMNFLDSIIEEYRKL